MHDHMSTSFNISLHSYWKLLYKHFWFIFTKHFTAYRIMCFHVHHQSWLDWWLNFPLLLCPVERPHIGFVCWNTFTGGNPWPLHHCPIGFIWQYRVKDVCSNTCAHCVLWWCRSLAKLLILHRWLVLGQMEQLYYAAVCLHCEFMCVHEPVRVCTCVCHDGFKLPILSFDQGDIDLYSTCLAMCWMQLTVMYCNENEFPMRVGGGGADVAKIQNAQSPSTPQSDTAWI